MKNIIITVLVGLSIIFTHTTAKAEDKTVCFKTTESVDIVTILNSSLDDIKSLNNCKNLLLNLENELDLRDKKIIELTDNLIASNKELIKIKGNYNNLKTYAYFSTAGNILLTILIIAL